MLPPVRILLCAAGALFAIGCGPSSGGTGEATTPDPEPPANPGWGATQEPSAPLPPGAPIDAAPWAIAARESRYPGVGLVPLVQLSRGSRAVILVWPALTAENTILDDDVVGTTLELRADGTWAEIHGDWGMRGPDARARLEQELGGADYTVRERREGAPFAELAFRFADLTARFGDAVAAHDRAAALEAAVGVSLLFPVEVVAFGDELTELLVGVSRGGRFEVVQVDPPTARITLRVRDGERTADVPFTAIHVNTEEDRWILGAPGS
jgi:hypothetical protein